MLNAFLLGGETGQIEMPTGTDKSDFKGQYLSASMI